MNEIKIFDNPQFGEIRTAVNENNDPLFCLSDVAKALGYSNAPKAVIDHCKGVTVLETPTNGGIQQIKFGKESEVYRLVMRSKLPDAEKFQDWVCEEVLPAIRKTGGYIVTKEEDTPEIILARAILVAQDSIKRLKQQVALQAKELKAQAPKAEYYDEVLDSAGLISTTIIAKDLGMSASTLNKKLHAMGIIFSQAGTWVPFAKYQNRGFCKSKTFPYTDKDGKQKTAIHFYWTEKGREFIMRTLSQPEKVSA